MCKDAGEKAMSKFRTSESAEIMCHERQKNKTRQTVMPEKKGESRHGTRDVTVECVRDKKHLI